MKKVLLIEPDYNNKFPPVGLMKIATYYRNLGDWEVHFYKGDLNLFVAERLADGLIDDLNRTEKCLKGDWLFCKKQLVNYIRYRKADFLRDLTLEKYEKSIEIQRLIVDAKDAFYKRTWKKEWDRVGVTTLFTFYWDKTVETIKYAKDYLVKNPDNLMVGGVLASIQPKELADATGLKMHVHGRPGGIHTGILRPGDLDEGDTQPIDELELDYSILDEIDYEYPMSNAYYRYTTRGCVNKCAFCAVPTLEPDYQEYIPLKERLNRVNELYGEQKDLLLMDNNVLASNDYKKIINEIIDCGFQKGAKFVAPDYLAIAVRNLKNGVNDRAYIKKSWKMMNDFYQNKLKDKTNSFDVYKIMDFHNMLNDYPPRKNDIISAYEKIKDIYEKHRVQSKGVLRFVDFNQGMDARLFTPEKAELLSKTAIRPVRIAFDDIKTEKKYKAAIEMCAKVGIRDFSNYLLYNFKDKPVDLYRRLRINVDLCEDLDVNIYSFPMKFHPIRKTEDMDDDYSHNRDYIGKHWNRKFIRAVQAVLNSTKGKIGRGKDFFEKAFGKDEDEFMKILYMPETMIIYRFFFEWLGTDEAHCAAKEISGNDEICDFSVQAWWECFSQCQDENLKKIIEAGSFVGEYSEQLLNFYTKNRKDITENDSLLWKLKEYYERAHNVKKAHYHKK